MLGQPVVIEYKGGAAPDGYTLLIVWNTHAVNHHVRGMEVVGSTPEDFAAFLKQQSETTGRLVKAAGIRIE